MTIDFGGLEQQYNLPNGLLSAVQQQESGGDPNAVSQKGAIGAFQFEPATAEQYGIDPTDPDQAAQGAAMMFGDLSKKYNGDVPSMLAAYNWGQGNLDRKGMENAPAETQNYIQRIQAKLPQGTQYAQADTGNMTDSTDHTQLSDAELDAQIAKLQDSQRVDPSKLSDADLDAQIAKLQGDTSFVSNYGQSFLKAANQSRIGIEQLGQDVGHALYGDNPQDAAEAASHKVSLAQILKEYQESGVNPSGVGGTIGNVAGSIAGTPASWIPMGEINSIADLARAGAKIGGVTGLTEGEENDTGLGNRLLQGAIGAGEGAAGAAAIGMGGKTLMEIPGGVANRVKGAFGVDTADEIASQSSKNWNDASQSFKDADATGAVLTQNAGQKILADVKKAVGNLNGRHADTQAELDDFENAVNSGNLTLSKLDEFRQNFADVIGDNTKSKIDGGGLYSDGQKAYVAKKAIMDSFDTLGDHDFSVGDADAAATLKQGINQWAQASRYDRIADILNNAGGDANKIKAGFTKFLKNDRNTIGFNADEIAALQDAATRGTGEHLERAIGAFGFGLDKGVGNVIPAVASGSSYVIPGGIPLAATGTFLRQTGKYAARGKGQTALDTVMRRNIAKPVRPIPPPSAPPLLLTAPKVTNVVNSYGQNVQTTPASRAIIGQSAGTSAEQRAGRSIEEDAAWQQHQAAKAQEDAVTKQSALDAAEAQKSAETKAIEDAEVARRIKEAGWKEGGIVKNRENHLSKKLQDKLGREPKRREIELATYVTPHGVHRLLKQKDVKLPAHKMFPEAIVKQHRAVFFNGKKPYTVEQIKAVLV